MSNSAVPQSVDFDLIRADSASWTLQVVFPVTAVSQDLNDWTITMSARQDYSDIDPLFSLVKGSGITIDGTDHKKAYIALDGELTEPLACPPPLFRSVCLWDIELLDSLGHAYTVARGTLSVFADVTRNA